MFLSQLCDFTWNIVLDDYGVKPEIVDMSIWLIWPNHLQGNLQWKLHFLGVPWVAYIDYILSFVAITVGHFLTSQCKLPSYLIHVLCAFLETLGVKWVVERGILKKEYYVHIIDWVWPSNTKWQLDMESANWIYFSLVLIPMGFVFHWLCGEWSFYGWD